MINSARPAGERGSGTLLAAGAIAVVLTLFVTAALAGGYLVAAHRARAAADLAALGAAAAVASGQPTTSACVVASSVAGRNAARRLACTLVGDPVDFVVTIEVAVTVPRPVPGLPTTVRARSHAGPTR